MKKLVVSVSAALILSGMIVSVARAEYLPTDAQVSQALALLSTLGQTHHTTVAYQVGESYRDGATAFFGVTFGDNEKVFWGYEEWESFGIGSEGEKLYLVTWWQFTKQEVRRRVNIFSASGKVHNVRAMEEVAITPEIATRSEKAWQLLSKVGVSI